LRVAVVTGRIGDLDPVAAGTAIGRGLAGTAQVAVVPVAPGGPDLATAIGALWGTAAEIDGDRWVVRGAGRVLVGVRQQPTADWAPRASTADLGEWLSANIATDDPSDVVLDLTGVTAHDGGAGLLQRGGAALRGRNLIGLVDADELQLPATGIGGGLARRAFAARLDVAELLAADAALAERARLLGEGLGTAPGGGAAGGSGLAVLASGGRVQAATQFCYQEAALERTLHAADLVITGCTELSALDRGGPVVTAVAAWAEAAQRPCLLVTTGAGLARRELRTLGIEAAHLLPAGAVTADGLAAVAARIAGGWVSGS
jgi:glycerate kinase